MATMSLSAHPLPPIPDGSPAHSDPFWSATPASESDSLPGVKSGSLPGVKDRVAVQKAPLLSLPQAQQTKAIAKGHGPQATASNRRPQCTHMTMNRVHGRHVCHMCGRVPNVEWVYVCAQDRLLQRKDSATTSDDTLSPIKDDATYFEAQAQLALSIGMSGSVVAQMKKGHYTFDQVETLLEQRGQVVDALIHDTEAEVTDHLPSSGGLWSNAPGLNAEGIIASLGSRTGRSGLNGAHNQYVLGRPFLNDAASTPTQPRKSRSRCSTGRDSSCGFQACHSCRPFLSERLYMSFQSIFDGDVPAVTEREAVSLPILDARTVSVLGLRQPSAHDDVSLSMQDAVNEASPCGHESHYSQQEESGSTSQTTSSIGSELSDDIEHCPCPGATVCPLCAEQGGCPWDTGRVGGQTPRSLRIVGLTNRNGNCPPLCEPVNLVARSSVPLLQPSTPTGCRTASPADSSVSLPETASAPHTPIYAAFTRGAHTSTNKDEGKSVSIMLADGRDHSLPFALALPHRPLPRRDSSGSSSESSVGSEVEVDGGLALTEEAVESGFPDIRTDGVALEAH